MPKRKGYQPAQSATERDETGRYGKDKTQERYHGKVVEKLGEMVENGGATGFMLFSYFGNGEIWTGTSGNFAKVMTDIKPNVKARMRNAIQPADSLMPSTDYYHHNWNCFQFTDYSGKPVC